MKTAILIASILLLTTNVNAAVKRNVKIQSLEVTRGQATWRMTFKHSFKEQKRIECKLFFKDKKSKIHTKYLIPKQRVLLTGIGKAPKKIKCWYWLK